MLKCACGTLWERKYLTDGLADAKTPTHTVGDSAVRICASLLGHAEAAGAKGFVDVLRGRAHEGNIRSRGWIPAPLVAIAET